MVKMVELPIIESCGGLVSEYSAFLNVSEISEVLDEYDGSVSRCTVVMANGRRYAVPMSCADVIGKIGRIGICAMNGERYDTARSFGKGSDPGVVKTAFEDNWETKRRWWEELRRQRSFSCPEMEEVARNSFMASYI